VDGGRGAVGCRLTQLKKKGNREEREKKLHVAKLGSGGGNWLRGADYGQWHNLGGVGGNNKGEAGLGKGSLAVFGTILPIKSRGRGAHASQA